MAIIYGLWIKCDECGQGAGDAGVAIEAPFELKGTTEQERKATEQEAVRHALDNGFVETEGGRMLCYDCAEPAEDDEDEDDDPHGGCWQPHVRGGEYFDCDGRAL
ncbi:MAG: hypothetical protein QOF58_3418 [Pseudonocardiales bacterium]|jgi:hypothetical protein|nr:hypothetical protein [Pseudonocardiales bacterium]